MTVFEGLCYARIKFYVELTLFRDLFVSQQNGISDPFLEVAAADSCNDIYYPIAGKAEEFSADWPEILAIRVVLRLIVDVINTQALIERAV